MQRRAQTIVEQATRLAADLRHKDRPGAKNLAQSMVKGLDMLTRALDTKVADLRKQSKAIETAMAARNYPRAASIAQALAEAARIFEDPNVQAVRRMGLGSGRLLACVEQDNPEGALFLLSLALWSEPAFSAEEAGMAAKAWMIAGQLEAALEQRHQKSALKLAKELASAAVPFAQSTLRRAQKLTEPCLQLRQALEMGHRSVALARMTAHLADLRAIGLPESRMSQALQDLLTLFGDLEHPPQRHRQIMALIQGAEELALQAGERAKRMGATGDDLARLIQAEHYDEALARLQELQANRALRDARIGVQEAVPQAWQASLMEKAPNQALKLLDSATISIKETVSTKGLSGLLDSLGAGRRPKE